MEDIVPFSYAKSYIFKQALSKATPRRLYYQHDRAAYSDLYSNKIYLPFIEPLDLGDLKVLLKHEEGHFSITKDEAVIPIGSVNLSKAKKVLNVLEDILVNESISRNRLERVFKKLSGESMQVTLWNQYSRDEKEKVVNKLKGKLFKDIDTQKIIETIEKTVEIRKKYDRVSKFVSHDFNAFKEFYDVFAEEMPKDVPGNGPAKYTESFRMPNPELVKKFRKIFQNLKINVEEITNKEQFYGKRINRKYLEDAMCIKPFLQRVTSHSLLRPKVLVLLDCSGSMQGKPEIKAKSFITACLDSLDCKIIGHNQYYHVVTGNTEEVNKLPMTGDEHFNTLKPEDYSCDVFVTVTDMNIDESEAQGLLEFGKHVKAKYKYLLVCSHEYYTRYQSLNEIFKRYFVGDSNHYIEFAKKLANKLV